MSFIKANYSIHCVTNFFVGSSVGIVEYIVVTSVFHGRERYMITVCLREERYIYRLELSLTSIYLQYRELTLTSVLVGSGMSICVGVGRKGSGSSAYFWLVLTGPARDGDVVRPSCTQGRTVSI